MDRETAQYIVNYFSDLFTDEERLALKHIRALDSGHKENHLRKMGWLTNEKDVLDLIKDGYEAFEINTATRIFKDNPDLVFLNICPICKKLARTPKAKQCRYCGFNWHYIPL